MINTKKHLYPFILLIISLIPLIDLVHPGLPITHDGQDHVARIANFYQSLSEGNIVPRWAGNLNWGYGHPILMFLYPMSSYVGSFFHFLGFSLVDSVKLVFAAAFIASGLTMYLWLREVGYHDLNHDIRKAEIVGFVGALLYMFAPYRFVDLYVRGAIGEHMAFVFPPLILYFLLKLFINITSSSLSEGLRVDGLPSPSRRGGSLVYLAEGALSLAGLILSHNAISLMFLPIISLYAVYLLLHTKRKKHLAINYMLLAVLGFGLSAFFWLPAFFEGKYTLRDIVTSNDYSLRFVPVKDFLFGQWSYGGSDMLSKQVGVIQWLFILIAIVWLIVKFMIARHPGKRSSSRIKGGFWASSPRWSFGEAGQNDGLFLSSVIFIFLSSLFLMTNFSKLIWDNISLLQKFQFPWRFLSVTVFASSVIGAFAVGLLPKKYTNLILIIITGLLLYVNSSIWHPKAYLDKPETFYTGIYNSTTDTGESSPIWSIRFMEHRPKAHLEVIDGKSLIGELKRTSVAHSYYVISDTKTKFRENTLYFPGWHVYVDDKEVPLQFQDPSNRGLMTFSVPPGKHDIVVIFTETKLRLIADVVSLISLAVIVGLSFIFYIRKRYE